MSRADLTDVMNVLLPHAEQLLAKVGTFYPFGAAMKVAGDISFDAAYDGRDNPPSQDLIDLLIEGFRLRVNELKAIGICFDGRVGRSPADEKTDAVVIQLEHHDGEAVEVYLPYAKDQYGKIIYGELFAAQGKRCVFQNDN